MNCPKCNSPINDGDKFCQVCGNVLQNNQPQQPTVAQTTVPPIVEQPAQPVQPQVENVQPVSSQPVMGPVPATSPMLNQQATANLPEPKKNNSIVLILAAVIVLLIAVVIYLVVAPKDEKTTTEDKTSTNTEEKNEPEEEKVVAKNYTETTVNGYTFKLPEGYAVELYNDEVVLYNNDMDFEAYVDTIDGSYDTINKEGVKVNLTAAGMTNVKYEEKTINNRKILIYSANYSGYQVEYIYTNYSYNKIVGASVVYQYNYNTVNEKIYDILTKVELKDSSFSSTTGSKLPNINIGSIIK